MHYQSLVLKPGKEKSLLNKHPWIFSGAVSKTPSVEDGAVVSVKSFQGEHLGFGFLDLNSQIVCRVFKFDEAENALFDQKYWTGKLLQAYELRKCLLDLTRTNCFRLIHAEGDSLPGLIADVYDDVVVLQVLITGMHQKLSIIKAGLNELGWQTFIVHGKDQTINQEMDPAWGNKQVIENGLKFDVDLIGGQKTGFFLDQRENRKLLSKICAGKHVLNAFSYSGGFSIYALAGGAESITSVDISTTAIDLCKTNISLNFPHTTQHEAIVADCFEYLRQIPLNKYDLIILDPPAFAKSKKDINKAARGYKDLNLQAFKKIRKNGMLLSFTCSQHISRELFQKIIFSAAHDAGREVSILGQLAQPLDHPVNIFHPEGAYLKGLWLWVQ
ncbi:MAG: class I SAM-dependent rRNA methyltransferase [Candidatus Cyclobacteriaceae bacterium M3_2C_046]